jgi:hypothetical protein
VSVVVTDLATERAWREGEAATVAAVSVMNRAVAALVDTIAMLDATGGWTGYGIRSLEHWVQWKANMSEHRAAKLVRVARRRGELPACWALFADGRLTEEAMVRIASRVPAERDREMAATAPGLMIAQLNRVLATLPPLPDPEDPAAPQPPERQWYLRLHQRPDGSLRGEFDLPADHGAIVQLGLSAGRDQVHRERHDLPDGADTGPAARKVTLADALVRLAQAGADALDGTLQRTGRPGDRHLVILHRDLRADRTLSSAHLHGTGVHLPDTLTRYLTCDTDLTIALHHGPRLVGFTPTDRTPTRKLRRWLERRDGGCVHPLCTARRWLHIHHLHHWEDGGPTIGSNLVCLCPTHHRALHTGDFTLHGNPETGTLTCHDRHGRPIEPPRPPQSGPPDDRPPTYQPPYGEPLREWTWN